MAKLSKKACGLLHKAEELLARRGGWIKGHFRLKKLGEEAKFCLVGAICEAAGERYLSPFDSNDNSKPVLDAIAALSEHVPEGVKQECGRAVDRVTMFNDRGGTKKGDVLALIQKTREAEGC